jgi:hypothetical protein
VVASGEQQRGHIRRQTGLLNQAPDEPFIVVSQWPKVVQGVKMR